MRLLSAVRIVNPLFCDSRYGTAHIASYDMEILEIVQLPSEPLLAIKVTTY